MRLLLAAEAVDAAEVDAEVVLERAAGGAGEGGAYVGRSNAEGEVRIEVDVAGEVDDEGWPCGVLPEAGLDGGETFGGSGGGLAADPAEGLRTQGVMQGGVEAVACASGEGVLVDLRVRSLSGVGCSAEGLCVPEHSARVTDG